MIVTLTILLLTTHASGDDASFFGRQRLPLRRKTQDMPRLGTVNDSFVIPRDDQRSSANTESEELNSLRDGDIGVIDDILPVTDVTSNDTNFNYLTRTPDDGAKNWPNSERFEPFSVGRSSGIFEKSLKIKRTMPNNFNRGIFNHNPLVRRWHDPFKMRRRRRNMPPVSSGFQFYRNDLPNVFQKLNATEDIISLLSFRPVMFFRPSREMDHSSTDFVNRRSGVIHKRKQLPSYEVARRLHKRRRYDVPQVECPPTADGAERFSCPSADRMGRYKCILDHSMCDGFIDCPGREDEDRRSCMFYQTTKAHLDVLADALLRWARGRY